MVFGLGRKSPLPMVTGFLRRLSWRSVDELVHPCFPGTAVRCRRDLDVVACVAVVGVALGARVALCFSFFLCRS